jgi:hypothetical protein
VNLHKVSLTYLYKYPGIVLEFAQIMQFALFTQIYKARIERQGNTGCWCRSIHDAFEDVEYRYTSEVMHSMPQSVFFRVTSEFNHPKVLMHTFRLTSIVDSNQDAAVV